MCMRSPPLLPRPTHTQRSPFTEHISTHQTAAHAHCNPLSHTHSSLLSHTPRSPLTLTLTSSFTHSPLPSLMHSPQFLLTHPQARLLSHAQHSSLANMCTLIPHSTPAGALRWPLAPADRGNQAGPLRPCPSTVIHLPSVGPPRFQRRPGCWRPASWGAALPRRRPGGRGRRARSASRRGRPGPGSVCAPLGPAWPTGRAGSRS